MNSFFDIVAAKIGFSSMYLPKMPHFIQKLFPSALFRMDHKERSIYLTFDDGPTPDVTDWVFELLDSFDAQATFFLLGRNMKKWPQFIRQAFAAGHQVGNHTYQHLDGWKTDNKLYFKDIQECDKVHFSSLFRPPYGKISFSQYKALIPLKKVVMWDVVSFDYHPDITIDTCRRFVMKYTQNGSIVVFHDSLKAFRILKEVLPDFLSFYADRGYSFKALPVYNKGKSGV